MEKLFKLQENKTDHKTEIVAGFTTFLTMAYIMFVNPVILSKTGMDYNSVTVATCIVAAIGTLLVGLLSNYPFAQAPGVGLNAFFVYTVCGAMAWQWQGALAAVFVSGVVFLLITISKARTKMLSAIPDFLKYAVGAGIGLFIASIGLKNGSLLSMSEAGFFIGDLSNPIMIHTIIGLIITLILVMLRVKGAVLLGIVISTIVGIFMPDGQGGTVTSLTDIILTPLAMTGFLAFVLMALFLVLWVYTKQKMAGALSGIFIAATVALLIANLATGEEAISLSPTFMRMDFSAMFVGPTVFAQIITFITVVLSFLIIEMSDVMDTVTRIGEKAGFLDEKGELPKAKQALASDAVATAAGAVIGTSAVTTVVESEAGVESGGKTGMTSLVVAVLFVLALVFTPIARIVPMTATAPAFIIVGILMMGSLRKIDWRNFMEAAPAFLTMIMMAFTTSIMDGIAFGFFTYAICKVFSGKAKEVGLIMWIFIIIFFIYYVLRATVFNV